MKLSHFSVRSRAHVYASYRPANHLKLLLFFCSLFVCQILIAQNANCNGTDVTPPTASNPFPISVTSAAAVPPPDPSVVIDEMDDVTTEPFVVWVSDVSDGNTCNLEVITRTYSVTDDCGNEIFVTQEITILAVYPPIDAGQNQSICEGETITLTAGNPWNVPFTWSSGQTFTNGQPFSPTATDTYTVTADNEGCISTDNVTVSVEELPSVSFSSDLVAGCAPLNVQFNNTSTGPMPLTDCFWEVNGSTYPGCDSADIFLQFPGSYDVTFTTTSSTGCTNSATYAGFILVEEVPEASFTASSTQLTTLDTEVDFENTSTGAVGYTWNFGYDTPNSSVTNPTHQFPVEESASFLVTLIASSGNCTDTAELYIEIEEDVIFYMPNSFTPDGDEFNQTFQPIFSSGFDPFDFSLLIFDRWGEVVWESHDTTVGWDGTLAGRKLPDGMYNWKLEFKTTATDERRMAVGHVNLLN